MDVREWLERTREVLASIDAEEFTDGEELNITWEYDDRGVMLIDDAYMPVSPRDDNNPLKVVPTYLAKELLSSQQRYLTYRLMEEEGD